MMSNNLSLNDLQNVPVEDLRNIQIENIIKICIDSLKIGEEEEGGGGSSGNKEGHNNEIKIIQLITNSLCRTNVVVPFNELDNQVFKSILPHFQTYIKNIIYVGPAANQISSQQTIDVNENLLNFMFMYKKMLSTILSELLMKSDKEIFSILKIENLLQNTLEILIKFYGFYRTRTVCSNNNDDILKNILIESQGIQSLIIKMLTVKNIQFFSQEVDQHELKFFLDLLFLLCNIGEIIHVIDIKSTAEIWKCILKISTDNAEMLLLVASIRGCPADVTGNVKLPAYSFKWLDKSIAFLCTEISNAIHHIKDSQQQQQQQQQQQFETIERILKVTTFYLKILLKFITIFHNGYEFQEFNDILKVLCLLQRTNLENVLPKQMSLDSIQETLSVDCKHLLNLIYTNTNFIKTFQMVSLDKSNSCGYLSIAIELSHKILLPDDHLNFIKNQQELISIYFGNQRSNNILFKIIFECLRMLWCPLEIFQTTIFNDLTIIICKVMYIQLEYNLQLYEEELLVKCVLDNDLIIIGYLIIDIWQLWTSLDIIDSEQRYNYFIFWMNIYKRLIDSRPLNLSHLIVKCILENLFDNIPLTLQKTIQQKYICNVSDLRLWSIIFNKRNNKQLLAIGSSSSSSSLTAAVTNTTDQLESYASRIIAVIFNIKQFFNRPNTNSYFEMVKELNSFSYFFCKTSIYEVDEDINEQLNTQLIQLWMIIPFNSNQIILKYSHLIIILIKIFINNIKNGNDGQITNKPININNSNNNNNNNNNSNEKQNMIIENLLKIPFEEHSNLNYLKLIILEYLATISTVLTFSNDLHRNKLLDNLATLMNRLLNDSDVIVRRMSFLIYRKIAFNSKYDQLILNSLKNDLNLKREMSTFLKEYKTVDDHDSGTTSLFIWPKSTKFELSSPPYNQHCGHVHVCEELCLLY